MTVVHAGRARRVCALLGALCVSLGAAVAQAGSPWLPASDGRLRHDVALLIDEGILDIPEGAWPIPIEDVQRGLSRVEVDTLAEPALQRALLRVQRVFDASREEGIERPELFATVGSAPLLRDYDAQIRADALLGASIAASRGRFSGELVVAGTHGGNDPASVWVDGSHLSMRVANWLLSANALDRWWGPGHEGSLILSSNARPMLGITLDRVASTRSTLPILRWFGTYRFTAMLTALERTRQDVDHPLFMGMRLSFKPAQILEVGLSRSAQFCGSGRPCNLGTIARLIAGRDNAGRRVSFADEPGNQMAGADFRLTSPFESLPLALYTQLIGEDSSSSLIPEKYLALFGAEAWALLDNGSSIRAHIEYSNTSCAYYRETPIYDCAYRQGVFLAGYRYRSRNIGHTTDSDSVMTAVGVKWISPRGDEYGVHAVTADLDRFGEPDVFNGTANGRTDYSAADLNWSGDLWGQRLSAQVGVERRSSAALGTRTQAFGFLSWRMAL